MPQLGGDVTVLDLDSLSVAEGTLVGRLAGGQTAALTRDQVVGLLKAGVNAQSGTTYTLALTDAFDLVECANADPVVVTVPTNDNVAFPVGTRVEVLQTGVGQVTLVGDTGVTVNAAVGLNITARWGRAVLVKRATNTWVAFGDLEAGS